VKYVGGGKVGGEMWRRYKMRNLSKSQVSQLHKNKISVLQLSLIFLQWLFMWRIEANNLTKGQWTTCEGICKTTT